MKHNLIRIILVVALLPQYATIFHPGGVKGNVDILRPLAKGEGRPGSAPGAERYSKGSSFDSLELLALYVEDPVEAWNRWEQFIKERSSVEMTNQSRPIEWQLMAHYKEGMAHLARREWEEAYKMAEESIKLINDNSLKYSATDVENLRQLYLWSFHLYRRPSMISAGAFALLDRYAKADSERIAMANLNFLLWQRGPITEDEWYRQISFWHSLFMDGVVYRPDILKEKIRKWLVNINEPKHIEHEGQKTVIRFLDAPADYIYMAYRDIFKVPPSRQPFEDGNHRAGFIVLSYLLMEYLGLSDFQIIAMNYGKGDNRTAILLHSVGGEGAVRTARIQDDFDRALREELARRRHAETDDAKKRSRKKAAAPPAPAPVPAPLQVQTNPNLPKLVTGPAARTIMDPGRSAARDILPLGFDARPKENLGTSRAVQSQVLRPRPYEEAGRGKPDASQKTLSNIKTLIKRSHSYYISPRFFVDIVEALNLKGKIGAEIGTSTCVFECSSLVDAGMGQMTMVDDRILPKPEKIQDERIKLCVADARELPFTDGSLDFMMFDRSMTDIALESRLFALDSSKAHGWFAHGFPKDLKKGIVKPLRETHRILKPGGYVAIITEPELEDGEECNRVKAPSIKKELESQKFEIVLVAIAKSKTSTVIIARVPVEKQAPAGERVAAATIAPVVTGYLENLAMGQI